LVLGETDSSSTTGFIHMEASMGGKWLELLTEIAPGVKRATIMFNPDTAPYARSYYLPSFEAAARSFKVAPIVAPERMGPCLIRAHPRLDRRVDL
jgi:putative ABC transport system substrate-binding protein